MPRVRRRRYRVCSVPLQWSSVIRMAYDQVLIDGRGEGRLGETQIKPYRGSATLRAVSAPRTGSEGSVSRPICFNTEAWSQ